MSEENKISNYIPINRKLFKNHLWKEQRTYSRFEAWIDLLQSARFENTEAKMLMGNKMVRWTRGQLPASLRFLSARWQWSTKKVSSFMELLEIDKMIAKETVKETGQTIITICNYKTYNPLSENGKHQKKQEGNSEETPGKQRGNKTKIVNNVNNGEEDVGALAPLHTQADEDLFKSFQLWIDKHAPRVNKMSQPLTIDEYLRLRQKLSKDVLTKILLAMQNRADLLKKNISANLTIKNWAKREEGGIISSETKSAVNEKLKEAFK